MTQVSGVRPALWPARTFGENPLLAYILVFLMAPVTLRNEGQSWFEQWFSPNTASLLFGLASLVLLFLILLVCHRRRWILKL